MPKGEVICEGCGQYESECKCKTLTTVACKIFNAGYTKSPEIKLTLISDEKISEIETPTDKEIQEFLANPYNQMGRIKDPTVLIISTCAILFAKKTAQAQLAHNEQEVKEQLGR